MSRPREKSVIIYNKTFAEIVCKHVNFKIDLESINLIKNYKWHSKKSKSGYFYCYSHLKGNSKILLHRLIIGLIPNDGKICDHKDRDTLNNKKSNLRICTRTENNRNAKKNKRGTTSKFKGVTKRPSGRFGVYIQYKGKPLCLGTYDSELEAAKKYNEIALQLFKEYANINKLGE